VTTEIVTAAVSNTLSAASTAAAVSSNAAGDAASATAAAGIAALSRVAVVESQGIAAAGRGRGRGSRSRTGAVVAPAGVARGGGTAGVNRDGVKNYSDQEVDYMLKNVSVVCYLLVTRCGSKLQSCMGFIGPCKLGWQSL